MVAQDVEWTNTSNKHPSPQKQKDKQVEGFFTVTNIDVAMLQGCFGWKTTWNLSYFHPGLK